MVRCDLPPALFAECPGYFKCHCGNTGVERTPNKSQQTKLTLEKKILLPLLPGFELATFRSRVRRSTNKLSRLYYSLHVHIIRTPYCMQTTIIILPLTSAYNHLIPHMSTDYRIIMPHVCTDYFLNKQFMSANLSHQCAPCVYRL